MHMVETISHGFIGDVSGSFGSEHLSVTVGAAGTHVNSGSISQTAITYNEGISFCPNGSNGTTISAGYSGYHNNISGRTFTFGISKGF